MLVIWFITSEKFEAGMAGAGLAIGAVAAAIGYFLRTSDNDEAIGNPLLDPDFVESVKQQVEGNVRKFKKTD